MASVIDVLRQIGVEIRCESDGMFVVGSDNMRPVDLTAKAFPGIPTDCQAQLMALLTTVNGVSSVEDTVFPDRFMHASELLF